SASADRLLGARKGPHPQGRRMRRPYGIADQHEQRSRSTVAWAPRPCGIEQTDLHGRGTRATWIHRSILLGNFASLESLRFTLRELFAHFAPSRSPLSFNAAPSDRSKPCHTADRCG